jgi:hypothetical protein
LAAALLAMLGNLNARRFRLELRNCLLQKMGCSQKGQQYRFVYDSSTKISYIFVKDVLEKTINQTGGFPAGYPTNIHIGTTGNTTGSFVGKLDYLFCLTAPS